jgi:glycosyltransferase involved in cell wall biosynthesis
MRILYFSKGYSPHDYRFLAALAETKHMVSYLKLEVDERQVEDRPVPANIEQIVWAGGRETFCWRQLPRLTLDLKRVIKEFKPNLIHAGPIQTCAFLAILSGFRPVLSMSWGFDLMQDAERNAWWRWVTRYTLQRTTFFTSDAQSTREKALSYGVDPERTVVFPWGVDLRHFSPKKAVAKKRGIKAEHSSSTAGRKEPFMLFCNRSWEPRYGVEVLVKAFVRVAQKREDVSLILLGGGSEAQSIRKILINGGVLQRVHFGGQIPQKDLPRWYQMADLYISPSHIDGSSVSLMEALACGLPALVSDIPANKEWVTDERNGWLFPDGNVDVLTHKLLTIMGQQSKLNRIRQAARDSALEKADWRKNFAILLKAYEKTIQAN